MTGTAEPARNGRLSDHPGAPDGPAGVLQPRRGAVDRHRDAPLPQARMKLSGSTPSASATRVM
jgi:hypothetical protein